MKKISFKISHAGLSAIYECLHKITRIHTHDKYTGLMILCHIINIVHKCQHKLFLCNEKNNTFSLTIPEACAFIKIMPDNMPAPDSYENIEIQSILDTIHQKLT